MLEILDTAGQETFSAMRELYMANGEGFALIYSITSSLSFAEVEKIRAGLPSSMSFSVLISPGIIKHKNTPQVPMALVGNKRDLEAKREVPTSKGKMAAKEWGCAFLESSAKTDTNIRFISCGNLLRILSNSQGNFLLFDRPSMGENRRSAKAEEEDRTLHPVVRNDGCILTYSCFRAVYITSI